MLTLLFLLLFFGLLAAGMPIFLVLGMCLVLVLDFWMSVRRELRLHAADMRHDQHVTGQAFGMAVADLWRTEGRARAMALVDEANRASDVSYVRWVDLDAPAGSRFAPQISASSLAPLRRGLEVQRTKEEPGRPGRFFTYVPVRADMSDLTLKFQVRDDLMQTFKQQITTLPANYTAYVARSYSPGIAPIIVEETSKMMLEGQAADATAQKIDERGNKFIQENPDVEDR